MSTTAFLLAFTAAWLHAGGNVFLGRRRIPGIEPGSKMRVEGMVGEMEGYLAMTNPTYLLLPRDSEEPVEH